MEYRITIARGYSFDSGTESYQGSAKGAFLFLKAYFDRIDEAFDLEPSHTEESLLDDWGSKPKGGITVERIDS
jgi:hypothetical protein